MAIPTHVELMIPFLEVLSDDKLHSKREMVEILSKKFKLTPEEMNELIPSGGKKFSGRVGWARTYLKASKLVESPERAVFKITERGKKALIDKPVKVLQYLKQYPEYLEFIGGNKKDNNDKNEEIITRTETPDELIAEARAILASHLEADLLSKIADNSPAFFEELVAKLLLSMGYGGSENDILQNRGKSGDGGIDGIIKQDVLGLDKIYIQAKRWSDNVVSRPEVQKFVGAVHGQNANRGVYITTSSFTNEAIEYANNINSNIILVDGKKLAKLMIEYNVGVQVKDTIQIKKIDEDFFIEGE